MLLDNTDVGERFLPVMMAPNDFTYGASFHVHAILLQYSRDVLFYPDVPLQFHPFGIGRQLIKVLPHSQVK